MITFEEIMKSLFYNKTAWYVDMFGKIKSNKTTLFADRNNCTSKQQIDKWLCLNDLLNIATYFNQEWTPDWNNAFEAKYAIVANVMENPKFQVSKITDQTANFVVFKNEVDAQQAIEILGNEKLERVFLRN
jgi:hypothetical protein